MLAVRNRRTFLNQKLFSQLDFHINKQEVAAIQVVEADSYPVYCVFLMGWLTKLKQKDIESVI